MESALTVALAYHGKTFIQDKSGVNSGNIFVIFDDYIAFLKF